MVTTMISFLHFFFLLVCAHFLADFPLQTEFMAVGKRPGVIAFGVPWYVILSAHATIHGGATYAALLAAHVALAPALGIATVEIAAHWLIDYAKGRGMFGAVADQVAHITCKAAYATMLVALVA